MMPQRRYEGEARKKVDIMQLYCWHCVVRHNVMLPGMHYASTSLIPNLLSCVVGEQNTLHCTQLQHKQRQLYRLSIITVL